MPLASLGAGETDQPTRMVSLPPRETNVSLDQLEQLTDREPERVAAQVRQWMQDS